MVAGGGFEPPIPHGGVMSLKIAQGEDIYYVMRQMGHSSIQVTIDTYAHLLKDRKPEAAAKTDDIVFGS